MTQFPALSAGPQLRTAEQALQQVAFNDQGLVPAVIQDAHTGLVLMLAWMNAQSLSLTLAEGRVVYWSRSRAELWRKGDTSGHVQYVRGMWLDCDGDTLLIAVEQVGAACHTGSASCFSERSVVVAPSPDALL